MGSIARNFDIGAQIHEDGLNILSARTYDARPELFEKREEVIVDAATRRKLILYLFVTEPLSFDFYPAGDPAVLQDQFSLTANIEFTLTDQFPDGSGLGLITRVKTTLYAIAGLNHNGNQISPGLQQFYVKNLVPDSPFPPHVTPGGALDLSPSIAAAEGAGGPAISTGDAFLAILNYLISVFLLKGLQRVVSEAPLPQIALLPDLGINLYLRGLSVETNRATIYMRDSSGDPQAVDPGPPAPAVPPHLAVGVVQGLLHRLLNALLPISVPVSGSCDSTAFIQAMPSNLTIPSADFGFEPPDEIHATVFLEGDVNFNLNVSILGHDIHVGLSIPLGPPTCVSGVFTPFARDNGDGTIDLRVRPTKGFFQPDFVIIATDWRDRFEEAAKQWVRDHVPPVLKHIPIIGWIVETSVEDIAGAVAGVLGGMLDEVASVFLTIIGNLAFHVIAQWFSADLSLHLYTIDQHKQIDGVPLGIRSVDNPRIEANGGGELVIDAWLFPEPAPSPLPLPQIPGPEPVTPQPPDMPCQPPAPKPPPSFPAYADNAFQPSLQLAQMAWTDGLTLTYDVTSNDGTNVTTLVRQASFHYQVSSNEWHLLLQSLDSNGTVTSSDEIVFDKAFGLASEDSSQTAQIPGQPPLAVQYHAAYDIPGRSITVSGMVGTQPVATAKFGMANGAIQFVAAESWMFRLMAFDLAVDSSGNFARSDIRVTSTNYTNWARFVPQVARVLGLDQITLGGVPVTALKVSVSDEQFIATVWIENAAPRRLLRCEQRTTDNIQIAMQIR